MLLAVTAAANESLYTSGQRERTVPIPSTITPIAGYPRKLVIFKMAASKFWQVRCWIAGRTHRKSTQTQNAQVARFFARQFYEQLSVFKWFETDGLISQRRDWLIGFKV